MTSYQKLKLKLADIENKLNNVCLYPSSINSILIINEVKFANQKSQSYLFGKYTPSILDIETLITPIPFGIIAMITND